MTKSVKNFTKNEANKKINMDIDTILASGALAVFIQVIGIFWLKERLKQSIKHEYDQDLEKLKKELEFDLDKKKKLYEGKLAQYKKYYALLDSYSQNSRKELFSGFNEGMLELIKNPSDENTLKYIQSSITLQSDLSDKFLTFKTEINGLRLEAGETMLKLLDEYVVKLEKAQEKTVQLMTWMNENATSFVSSPDTANQHIQQFIENEFNTEGQEMLNLQEAIFREMRRELGIV